MPLHNFLADYQKCELRTIIIPGSHDAGLAAEYAEKLSIIGTGGSNVITQSVSVGQQALRGSRFFDVRIMEVGGELKSFHAMPLPKLVGYKSDSRKVGAAGQGFDSILDELKDFVRANPSEFIIVRLSHLMDTAKIFQNLHGWIAANNNYVYKVAGNLATKTVAELAGKVVLIIEAKKLKTKNLVDFDGDRRIPRQEDGFHAFYQSKEGNLPEVRDGLCVCGEFSNSHSVKDIVKKQIDNYTRHDQHRNYTAGQAHLYSLYWTSTGGNIETNTRKQLDPPNFIKMTERMKLKREGVNPNLTMKSVAARMDITGEIALTNGERRRLAVKTVSLPNIILYDFINEGTSQQIINLNDLVQCGGVPVI